MNCFIFIFSIDILIKIRNKFVIINKQKNNYILVKYEYEYYNKIINYIFIKHIISIYIIQYKYQYLPNYITNFCC